MKVAYYNRQWLTDGGPGSTVHDVGLLELTQPISTSAARYRAMYLGSGSPPDGTHMTQWGYGPDVVKRHADFYWPNHTYNGQSGDSGGPVIRGDTGQITRVHVGSDLTYGYDDSSPLSASAQWITTALAAHAIY